MKVNRSFSLRAMVTESENGPHLLHNREMESRCYISSTASVRVPEVIISGLDVTTPVWMGKFRHGISSDFSDKYYAASSSYVNLATI